MLTPHLPRTAEGSMSSRVTADKVLGASATTSQRPSSLASAASGSRSCLNWVESTIAHAADGLSRSAADATLATPIRFRARPVPA